MSSLLFVCGDGPLEPPAGLEALFARGSDPPGAPQWPQGPDDSVIGALAAASPRGLGRVSYRTWARASAGRSLAARQPPKPPATRPPATASSTASRMMLAVTGAVRCTEMVLAASPDSLL